MAQGATYLYVITTFYGWGSFSNHLVEGWRDAVESKSPTRADIKNLAVGGISK